MEPTIYKPSIYKSNGVYNNGAGGETNPDGSLKKIGLLNKSTSKFLDIEDTFHTKWQYEFTCTGFYGGLFGIINYSISTYYYATYLGFRETGYTAEGRSGLSGNYSVSGYNIGAINTYKIKDDGTLSYSLDSNGQQVFTDSISGYGDGIVSNLNIFRCYKGQNCGRGLFMGLKITDVDEVIHNYTPAEKNGVPGVFDDITETFYPDSNPDGNMITI